MKQHHGLLNEKYRPQNLGEFVGNENLKSQVQKFLDQNDIINLLLYGPPGCGKTTLAKLIVKNLDCDYIYINASEERGIETIRDKVSGFASTASFKSLKVIILDEADYMTINAQTSLRGVIETFSVSTRFILTCNYIERIIDPLQSRCEVLKVIPPSKKEIAKHLSNIIDQEEIKYEVEDLVPLINRLYPDLRKMLNQIQLSTINKVLKLNTSILVSSNYILKILEELKEPKPDWIKIRQIILDSGINDFEELFKALYDNSSKYLPNKEGMVAILINQYSYYANFKIDKEINCMALIKELINLK